MNFLKAFTGRSYVNQAVAQAYEVIGLNPREWDKDAYGESFLGLERY